MNTKASRRGPMMMAVVLGTALSAVGAQSLHAAEPPVRAVNDIGRYCTSCWRNARLPVDAWGDCTQEVFRRLLERVPAGRWQAALHADGEERREFLRAIDAVKKRTQRAKRHGDGVDLAADPNTRHERKVSDDREAVRLAAEQVLSERQQRILRMSFEGHTVNDISGELGLPAQRVSDEKYKAIRKLREHLAGME
jgi:RNA polymerase sigma factor (sigma-70 family)